MAIDTDPQPTAIHEPFTIRDGAIVEPGGIVRLVAFERNEEELARSVLARMNPEAAEFLTPGVTRTEEEIRKTVSDAFASERTALFAITDEAGNILGEADLSEIDGVEKSAYLTVFVYHESDRGHGIGSRVAMMLLAYARQMGLTRVFAETDRKNVASMKTLEKLPVTVRTDEDFPTVLELEIHLDQWDPPVAVAWVPNSTASEEE